ASASGRIHRAGRAVQITTTEAAASTASSASLVRSSSVPSERSRVPSRSQATTFGRIRRMLAEPLGDGNAVLRCRLLLWLWGVVVAGIVGRSDPLEDLAVGDHEVGTRCQPG